MINLIYFFPCPSCPKIADKVKGQRPLKEIPGNIPSSEGVTSDAKGKSMNEEDEFETAVLLFLLTCDNFRSTECCLDWNACRCGAAKQHCTALFPYL